MIRPVAAALGCLLTLLLIAAAAPDQRQRVEQGSPLALEKAAGAMTLPSGFAANLYAGEPDVHQPIGVCVDPRGRLWVAQNDSYPKWESSGKDNLIILEDSDLDGKFDKRTVFAEGFHYITGVQVGLGGVWVMDCPNLLFFPVKTGEDKPSGPPVVHLDGWNWKGVHNVPNSLTWGPDGWLYGCNGITVDSLVGVPGTPEDRRVRLNCGVWRYHPTKKIFEHHAEGTTNPWGLDYDLHGQMFMSNNVVPHLWHVIQGAHYRRMHGRDLSPYIFEQIQTCADHLHWGGGDWTSSRGGDGIHSAAGGGHSHAGIHLYYGPAFPADYRGTILMCNTHGHRINNDSLEPRGSGFVGKHRPDFCFANDPWFKGVAIHDGPDGSIYVIDWSDTGECHDYDVTDRLHGRIFRIAPTGTKPVKVDLEQEGDEKLVAYQTSDHEWFIRRARLILRDRAVTGKLTDAGKAGLSKMFDTATDPLHRLRAMWCLWQCGLMEEGRAMKATADADPYVRGWAIQYLAEDRNPSAAALERFAALAKSDPSPVVRLYLAAAMQRTPVEKRWAVLEPMVTRRDDMDDANLPYMYWYALEGVIAADAKRAVNQIIPKLAIPKLRSLSARRLITP